MDTYELIVSICAAIVAICALLVSVQQGLATRRHNILSVKPKIHFKTENIGPHEKFQLFLTNNGIGPAVIKKTKVIYREQEIKESDPLLVFLALAQINKIVGGGEKFTAYSAYHIGEYTVLPGSELLLMEFGRNEKLSEHELEDIRRKIIPELNNLNIEITYQSMYGDEDGTFHESLL